MQLISYRDAVQQCFSHFRPVRKNEERVGDVCVCGGGGGGEISDSEPSIKVRRITTWTGLELTTY